MINAKEARERMLLSEGKMNSRVERICKAIEAAADNEKSFLLLDSALPYELEYKLPNGWRSPLNPLLIAVKLRLENLGFVVTVIEQRNEEYAGFGHTEPRPAFTSHHIRIGW